MNLTNLYYCPVCGNVLHKEYTPGLDGRGYNLLSCSIHYFQSQLETGEIIYSQVTLPGQTYRLNFDDESTVVFKYDPQTRFYSFLITLPGQLELDFNNLQATVDRLNNLLPFL